MDEVLEGGLLTAPGRWPDKISRRKAVEQVVAEFGGRFAEFENRCPACRRGSFTFSSNRFRGVCGAGVQLIFGWDAETPPRPDTLLHSW